jgi:PDZ domain/Aspartyl protease
MCFQMRTTNQIILWLVVVSLTLATPLTQPSQHTLTAQSAVGRPVIIPVEITSYGGIVLQARINNSQPMSFWLDSGSTSPFVIGLNKATALGLKLQGHVSGAGAAGPNTYEVSQTSGLTIALARATFARQNAAVMSLGLVEEQFGRPVDGLVGLDLFLKYVVEIDYAAKQLTLFDPQSYVYSGTGESVSLTLRHGHFFVPAKIEIQDRGELVGQFVVDTGGCMMTAIVTAPFAQRNKLPFPAQKTILDRSISGLGGETRLLIARASHFKIGSSVLPAPIIYISQDKGGALASSEYEGLIGTEILRRFKVIFDYPRRRLILERNADFEEPLEYDMSGMSLRAYGNEFRIFKIYQVLEDSPAGRAGLRVGDIIERIDAVPASRLTLEQILQMMKVPGREYGLTIKRDSHKRLVMIKTKRLI